MQTILSSYSPCGGNAQIKLYTYISPQLDSLDDGLVRTTVQNVRWPPSKSVCTVNEALGGFGELKQMQRSPTGRHTMNLSLNILIYWNTKQYDTNLSMDPEVVGRGVVSDLIGLAS